MGIPKTLEIQYPQESHHSYAPKIKTNLCVFKQQFRRISTKSI